MTADPPAPAVQDRARRNPTGRSRPTAETDNPMACLAEIAGATELTWAIEQFRRLYPRLPELRDLAKRRDLSAEACDIAHRLHGNATFDAKEARRIRQALFNTLASLMAQERRTPRPSPATRRRKRMGKRKAG